MATKFWLYIAVQSGPQGCGFGLDVAPGFWDCDTVWSEGASIVPRLPDWNPWWVEDLPDTQSGPITYVARKFASFPVTTPFTLSGTVTFNIWAAAEGASNPNAGLICRMMKWASNGVVTLVGEQAKGTEISSGSWSLYNWTLTPTSTVFETGDRILMYLGITDAGGTMNPGVAISIGVQSDAPEGETGDSWITISENPTFDTENSYPTGTILYLRDTASDIIDQGAGVDEKSLRLTRGSTAVTAVKNTVAGPVSGLRWTKTAGGNAVEWYSPGLEAFTLSGKVFVRLRGLVSNALETNASFLAEVARVDNNGANPVVWGKQLVGNAIGYSWVAPLSTSQTVRECALTGPDLEFAEGQRLRLRVYCDEQYPGVQVGGYTATLYYDGPTAGSSGDSFIQVEQTLVEAGTVTQAFQIPYEAEGVLVTATVPRRRGV